MMYKLLYIDDEPTADAIADGFNTRKVIEVKAIKPTSFEAQLQELIDQQSDFDGLILDLKLDENLSGERKAYYTATSLATQIRSKVTEGVWSKEFPIFLFTTRDKLNHFFSGDEVSHDLFDLCFIKEKINDDTIQNKIFSVIQAYDVIRKFKPDISRILDINEVSRLDKRIFPSSLNENSSVYSFSRLILNELILKPGPLIDENYLAARLGVDLNESNDWNILKNDILKNAKYSGIYETVWERWWMHRVNDWWEGINAESPLASLDARQRLELLKEKLKLNLVVAQPLPKAASYRYWTVCQGYNRPLDPREGLRVDTLDPFPWQETKYISVEAALERVKRDEGLKIHPSEKERFNDIKQSIKA